MSFIPIKYCGHCLQHNERQIKWTECLPFYPNIVYDRFDDNHMQQFNVLANLENYEMNLVGAILFYRTRP
jgi:hypothetical protein